MGTGVLPMGQLVFNNVDISGKYVRQFIGLQRFQDTDLTMVDVKLGGLTSEISGTFGAGIRFDAVGFGSLLSPATVNLGDTLFRGLSGGSTQRHEIEIAPDNSHTFLRVDASGTTWTVGGIDVAATDLDVLQAFNVEDRILHYVDKLHPAHGTYKGFVEVQDGQAFITDAPDSGLVGDGSIQRGVDIVDANGTVNVSTGTFNQTVNVNRSVTIDGQGVSTVIDADGAANAITIAADDITLSDLRVTDAGTGISFASPVDNTDLLGLQVDGAAQAIQVQGSITDLALDDVTLTGNTTGIRVGTAASVVGLDILNSHFDGNTYGMTVYANVAIGNETRFNDILIKDSTFNNNTSKGLYFEKLNNATLDNVTVDNSGTVGGFGAGIDINLKYGNFTNIQILGGSITDSGTGDAVNGSGLTIKARGTGNDLSYASPIPATLTNSVVDGMMFDGNQAAIRIGEPGKDNIGPTLTLQNLTIDNSLTIGVDIIGGDVLLQNSDLNNNPLGVRVTGANSEAEITANTFTGGLVDIRVENGIASIHGNLGYSSGGTAVVVTGGDATVTDVISGVAIGVDASGGSVDIDGSSITASTTGVVVGGTSQVDIQGTTITTGGTGTGVLVQASGNAEIDSTGGLNTISNNLVGIDLNGGTATVLGNAIYGNSVAGVRIANLGVADIQDNDFEGLTNPDNAIDLQLAVTAGLLVGGVLIGNTFAGTTYIDNKSNQNILALIAAPGNNVYKRDNVIVETLNANIENRIYHLIDDVASGLVTWVANTIYVTPAPAPSATDNDYTRLANAFDALTNGTTLVIDGTFDWTESNAALSWSKGNDANDLTTLDNYSILIQPNLNNITVTAVGALGSAVIQGPDDLAGVDLEGVLFFNGGDNKNWTIENLTFLDFDLSIGMFGGAGGTDAYDNLTIQGNRIRIATDLNATVAPDDSSQNIGIHYAYGVNQKYLNNLFEIPGDGISDSANARFSTSVAMQSNTSGGSIYNGLLIDGNIIHVLNGQSADPEVILGIWENGHAHTSNVTVSNNQFINDSLSNDPTLNLQRAFRVTSHSGASTTVTYSNNQVSGANIGFQWIAGSNFAAQQPVVVSGNTLTNVNTGFLVQSNGKATFTGNSLTNSGAMFQVGKGIEVLAGSVVTIDGSPDENAIVGFGTGILAAGTVTVVDNDASIHGNLIGIDVTGTATITNNHLYNNGTAIRFAAGGTGSVTDNNFAGPADNGTDLLIASTAGIVTIGDDNAFAGDTYYIDNQSTQSFDLSLLPGTSFDELNNFRIEDKMHHRMDTDLSVLNGLITWVNDTLFVTDGGDDHSIERGVLAATAGDTILVEAGTYSYASGILVNKALTIRGAQYGTDARDRVAAESVIDYSGAGPAGAFDISSDNVTIDGFYFDAPSRAITANGGLIPINNIKVLNNIVDGQGSTLYAFFTLRVGSAQATSLPSTTYATFWQPPTVRPFKLALVVHWAVVSPAK